MRRFKPMTMQELISRPPETREHAYRRGYRDGYIAAMYAVYGDQGVPDHLWTFWLNALLAWQNAEGSQVELPPTAKANEQE